MYLRFNYIIRYVTVKSFKVFHFFNVNYFILLWSAFKRVFTGIAAGKHDGETRYIILIYSFKRIKFLFIIIF